ncbi:DUF3291 domain-containing protein [Roseibium sp. FZY0029]|uniref:DUF3291 domain-containing protein n=1 Tax=Roseibium sp. FZY0029 TaxID=3116647 RepID=UPI002EB3FC40|nr:DUF3291 domain-containing protein [Roseibium sp. FZY0029]
MIRKQHLAELNVARLRYEITDPRIADFVNNLDRVNAAAERSSGFVWRLKDEAGNATSMASDNDPLVIPNLSVWTDVSSLENFVFKTVHKRIYDRRAEWFEVMERMHFVMWPVDVGHEPTLQEALQKLDYLNTHGSTDLAFGWDHVKDATLWRSARCSSAAA